MSSYALTKLFWKKYQVEISCFNLKFKKPSQYLYAQKNLCFPNFDPWDFIFFRFCVQINAENIGFLTIVKDFNMLISKSHKLDKRTIFF